MPIGPPPAPRSPAAGPSRSPGRSGAVVAWFAIAAAVLFLAFRAAVTAPPPAEGRSVAGATFAWQVRTVYGTREWMRDLENGGEPEEARRDLLRQLTAARNGPPSHRQRLAVIAGDLGGPPEAIRILDELEALLDRRGRPLEGRTRAVEEALRDLYGSGAERHGPEAAAALSPERRRLLVEELGWFGRLALAPEGSPDREALMAPLRDDAEAMALYGALGLAALLLGGLGAILFWVRAATGRVRFRFRTGESPAGVYAEAFALWLLLFLGISLLVRLAGPEGPGLVATGLLTLISLVSLAWLPLRGVPWSRVREDLGLRLPSHPLAEAAAGIACWAMNLPVLLGAALLTVVLLGVQAALRGAPDPLEPLPGPYHPVLGEIREGGSMLPVLVAASVIAPFVEEIAFRGLLYRHLREGTARWGRAGSVAASALLTGLVFAAVHPQGWVLIPALAAVSWGLVHCREWRGSLLGPMVAHGVHNAIVTTFAVRMLTS